MDENTSYVPKLTLNPTAVQAAVEEAPVEEQKEEEKEPVKAEKLDISSLSPAEQAAVREFSEQIDILNTEQVMNYGSAAQKNISEFSDAALNTVRTKDLGEVGDKLSDLVVELKGLNFSPEEKKGLKGLFKNGLEAGMKLEQYKDVLQVEELNRLLTARFGFDRMYDVCGQTYPRKLDSRILSCLSGIAQSCCKMATDIRLLQHDRQLEEPFENNQIGSSAMAYKRNPMRCERICSLSRYLMSDVLNATQTASTQWLERTLDDSANRRISLPEGFLCTDAVLRLARNVVSGLRVNEKIIEKTILEYLPFIATENLMMEAVKRGGDRQELHEVIRRASMEATARMKQGESCNLPALLGADPAFPFSEEEIQTQLDPKAYTGRCAEQVSTYLEKLQPLWADLQKESVDINV